MPVRKVPPPTQEMPFLEHLEELRWVVFRSLIGLIAGMIVCFIFAQDILQILTYPASQLDPPLIFQFLKVQGMLIVYLEIGFFGGLALALPLIFQQLWSFISPGLHQREKRYFLPLMISVTTLFMVGISFAYFVIVPFALNFFVGLAPADISANIAIDFYIGFAIRLMFLFGIVFEMPVISYFLAKIGLITKEGMRNYRRHAIVGIFVAAALLTPPDPVTQIFLGIPLVLLYEFSIFIAGRVEKNAKHRAGVEEQQYLAELKKREAGEDLPSQEQ